MKKVRFVAVLTVFCLALSGCAALLDREYVDVTPYKAVLTTEGDPSTLRAESYPELVNALIHFVSTGADTGRVRLYMESENLASLLDAACLEVVQEDPLGAYAVDYIKYSISPVVTYSEAEVQIFYRRSREQVEAITSVTGTAAIRAAFESLLSSFDAEQVLRISYFDGDEAFIRDLFQQTYYSEPLSAVDLPSIEISIYPNTGRQRIVELNLSYHSDPIQLKVRRKILADRVEEFCQSVSPENVDALSLGQQLLAVCQYAPEGGATAYHAFTEGTANAEGLALAYAALCERMDIPCLTVRGSQNGIPHFWHMVRMQGGWYHMDLTVPIGEDESAQLLTDEEATAAGYLWPADSYPRSAALSLLPVPEEPAESASVEGETPVDIPAEAE